MAQQSSWPPLLTSEDLPDHARRPTNEFPPPKILALSAAVLLVGDLIAAWFTSRVDLWEFLPPVVIASLGVAFVGGFLLYRYLRARSLAVSPVVVGILLITALMAFGSFYVALPLKMFVASGSATSTAQRLLEDNVACSSAPGELRPVGSLIHATRVCTFRPGVETTYPVASFEGAGAELLYSPAGYEAKGVSLLPQICVRHLYGPWWAARPDNPDAVTAFVRLVMSTPAAHDLRSSCREPLSGKPVRSQLPGVPLLLQRPSGSRGQRHRPRATLRSTGQLDVPVHR